MSNHIPPACGVKRGESASPERKPVPAPRYNPETWKDVGKGFLKALLDVEGASVWSRLPLSRFKTLERVRELRLAVGCVEGKSYPGEGINSLEVKVECVEEKHFAGGIRSAPLML